MPFSKVSGLWLLSEEGYSVNTREWVKEGEGGAEGVAVLGRAQAVTEEDRDPVTSNK